MRNYILSALLFLLVLPVKSWAVGDADALSIISTIDRNEIAAADYVLSRNIHNPDVTNYAKMLKNQHSDNLAKAVSLENKLGLSEQNTPSVMSLKAAGAKDLATLKSVSDDQLAATYLSSETSGHNDALNLINNQIKPTLQNGDVKNFVNETEKAVNDHMKAAQGLQQKM